MIEMMDEVSSQPLGTENAESPPQRKPDDDDIALELVTHWDGKVAYFLENWQIYGKGVWTARSEEAAQNQARLFLRQYRGRGVGVTLQKVRSVCGLARLDVHVETARIEAQAPTRRKYINLRNGLYNLETHKLEPHRPDLYFTHQLPFAYDPDAGRAATFFRFLETSLVIEDGTAPDRDMAILVGEALAYSMTARTDLKSSFWIVGKPDSGKSTLVTLIRSLMGSLHQTIDLNQLTNRFIMANTYGKRVLTFTEADSTTVLPDAIYKSMVGGTDEIYADVKNKAALTFVPEFKVWWAMNDAPRTVDRSGAVINRLRVIRFNRTIPPEERDPQLHSRLAAELPAIFNWLMKVYAPLVTRGSFTIPEQSERWLKDYQERSDTEGTFIRERCERVIDGMIQSEKLYQEYSEWCRRNGFTPKNMNQVAPHWDRLGLMRVQRANANYWKGVQLRPIL